MIHEFAPLKSSFHIPIMVLPPACGPVNFMVKSRDDSTALEFNRATATSKKVKQVSLLILEKLHTLKNAMVRQCRQSRACFGTTGCSQRWWKWRQQTWQPNPLNHSHINNEQHKSAPRLTPTGKFAQHEELSYPEWAHERKLQTQIFKSPHYYSHENWSYARIFLSTLTRSLYFHHCGNHPSLLQHWQWGKDEQLKTLREHSRVNQPQEFFRIYAN